MHATPASSRASILEPERATPSVGGVPREASCTRARRRRVARPRRERERVSLAQRRRAGGARRDAGHVDVGKGNRERLRAFRTRGQTGGDGARRARSRARACVPPVDDPRSRARRARSGDRDDGDVRERAGDRDAGRSRRAATRRGAGRRARQRRRRITSPSRAAARASSSAPPTRTGRRRRRSARCSFRRRSVEGSSRRPSWSATRTPKPTLTGRWASSTRRSAVYAAALEGGRRTVSPGSARQAGLPALQLTRPAQAPRETRPPAHGRLPRPAAGTYAQRQPDVDPRHVVRLVALEEQPARVGVAQSRYTPSARPSTRSRWSGSVHGYGSAQPGEIPIVNSSRSCPLHPDFGKRGRVGELGRLDHERALVEEAESDLVVAAESVRLDPGRVSQYEAPMCTCQWSCPWPAPDDVAARHDLARRPVRLVEALVTHARCRARRRAPHGRSARPTPTLATAALNVDVLVATVDRLARGDLGKR